LFPLRDNIPSRTFPFVNYAMIGLCSLVFMLQLGDGPETEGSLVERFGMIPALVWNPQSRVVIQEAHWDPARMQAEIEEREVTPTINPWLTLVTCVFLHGGWLHFLGNMWFLHIFGDNVEDRMGHVGYALFYLFCGVMASVAHLVTNANSSVPTIGASGAIAGVMGAYLLLYPGAMVTSVIPIIIFIEIMVLPAPIFLGIWFLMQFIQGTVSISSVQTTGVAWWAHIGGFVAGAVIAVGLRAMGQTTPPVERRRPGTDHTTAYRYHRPVR
jgi:membrane associated rhomboid family serine protease